MKRLSVRVIEFNISIFQLVILDQFIILFKTAVVLFLFCLKLKSGLYKRIFAKSGGSCTIPHYYPKVHNCMEEAKPGIVLALPDCQPLGQKDGTKLSNNKRPLAQQREHLTKYFVCQALTRSGGPPLSSTTAPDDDHVRCIVVSGDVHFLPGIIREPRFQKIKIKIIRGHTFSSSCTIPPPV